MGKPAAIQQHKMHLSEIALSPSVGELHVCKTRSVLIDADESSISEDVDDVDVYEYLKMCLQPVCVFV
jgi:hypothetical protein